MRSQNHKWSSYEYVVGSIMYGLTKVSMNKDCMNRKIYVNASFKRISLNL